MITPSKRKESREVWIVEEHLDAREMADLLWQANQHVEGNTYDDRYTVHGHDEGVRIEFPFRRTLE